MADAGQDLRVGPNGVIATPTTTVPAPVLPTLPDPNSFWSQPGPSSLFLLQEARANVSIFNDFKTHIQSGQMSCNLPPPRLPPLPPIPQPSTSTIHTPRVSTTLRPAEKPELPSKWKGKARAECLVEFQDQDGEWIAEEKYNGRAIQIKGPGMTVWVEMSGSGEEVGGVKVFFEKSSSRADLTSSGWHTGLSTHLTSLNLSLPELLYRIPHLPDLMTKSCFYCSKYLKMPDGLPVQHTGYLPKQDEADTGKSNSGLGSWVCWHASCGEP